MGYFGLFLASQPYKCDDYRAIVSQGTTQPNPDLFTILKFSMFEEVEVVRASGRRFFNFQFTVPRYLRILPRYRGKIEAASCCFWFISQKARVCFTSWGECPGRFVFGVIRRFDLHDCLRATVPHASLAAALFTTYIYPETRSTSSETHRDRDLYSSVPVGITSGLDRWEPCNNAGWL